MPKKREPEKPIAKDDPKRIIDTSLEDVMHNSMMPYAEHVIMERALPRVEDGLKPVQRRILYTMMELGTTPDKPHRKCARIVGDCLGKYHPHGDSSVYGALTHMAQDFSMRAPLVDGHGNFGSIDGDSPAAMRYTEARMTPLALEMLRDLEKDTVPFRFNFDDSLKEPDMLPARFPNLLVNGSGGIAVGLATNIPPHHLGEAVRATIAQIENPDISLDDLMQIMPGPDFPTGGVLIRNEEIRSGYETGRGRLTLRAKTHFEDGPSGHKLIVITEIPFQVSKSAMLEHILKLSEEKKSALDGISDIRDESDRAGIRAVIELKKGIDPSRVLAYLYKYSELQITFGVNMVAIANGKPVLMGLKRLISCYIDYQKKVVTRRTEFDLKQAKARAHILEGLLLALDRLDEIIKLIRASKSPKEAKAGLVETFTLTEPQAQAILDMRLQRLTRLERDALKAEYAALLKDISRYEGILGSEKKLLAVIRKELSEIADKYETTRRTAFEDEDTVPAVIREDAPAPEDTVVLYTRGGYLKRLDPASLRRSGIPEAGDDPDSAPRFLLQTDTASVLYVFTNHGNCYTVSVSSITESKLRDRGQLLSGILPGLEENENALFMSAASPGTLSAKPCIMFLTRRGMIKLTPAAQYEIRSKKFPAIKLKGGDEVIDVRFAAANRDVLIVTNLAMSIRFPYSEIPEQGRAAGGVRAVLLSPNDAVSALCVPGEQEEVLLMTERGWGKRVAFDEFIPQARAGKGLRCLIFKRSGDSGQQIAGALPVKTSGDQKLLIRQARSAPSLLSVSTVPKEDRTSRGKPCVTILMDDIITAISHAEPETGTEPGNGRSDSPDAKSVSMSIDEPDAASHNLPDPPAVPTDQDASESTV